MKILYLAPIAFDGLKQRPQHIAEELAKENEVWYIEPTISIMKYMIKGGECFSSKKYDITHNLHIIRLNGILTPHISIQGIDYFNISLLSEKIQLSKYLKTADLIWIGYSGWYGLFKNVKDIKIVYDKMDEDINITQNLLLIRYLTRIEPKLIDRADYIFVTAIKFYKTLSEIRNSVFLIPNAVSIKSKINRKEKIESEKRIFGYIGTISHWFDIDVIKEIAEADVHNEIILVGPNMIPRLEMDNVKYVGPIDKEHVFDMISKFDVCLYPFKINSLLDTINPVKIYEYLAMNKPVLAVNSIETKAFGNLLETYSNYSELNYKSKKKFQKPFKSEQELLNFLEENSWEVRVKDILDKIKL